jgi:hypothetical protein
VIYFRHRRLRMRSGVPTPCAGAGGMRRPLLRALVLCALLGRVAGASPFADQVVGYQIGTGGGAGLDAMPGIVLGPPHGGGAFHGSTDTLSLGLGGWIVLAFDDPIVDGPGPDFTVFENPFLPIGQVTYPPFAEPGTVSVSADGETWVPFPCHLDEPPYYPGCAGVFPVFANADDSSAPSPLVPCTTPIQDLVGVPVDTFVAPSCSGGDSFDLADVGLPSARFLRIDASQLEPGLAGTAGFDLDAVAEIHFAGGTATSTTTVPANAATTTTIPADLCQGSGAGAVVCLLKNGFPAPECSGEHLPRGFRQEVHRAIMLAARASDVNGTRGSHLSSALAKRLKRTAAVLQKIDGRRRLSSECIAALERLLAGATSKIE